MNKIFIVALFLSACLAGNIFASGTMEINTATLQQLETLTDIGPVKAQAIISARPFSSLDDLLKVSGIGPKTLQKIKNQGLAYVNGNPSQTQNIQTPAPILTPTPTPKIIYPAGIFINEILPDPKGPDETDEWIELYNSNNFDVDLSEWQMKDSAGTITTFTVPQNTKISSNRFLVFKRPDTNIMLNNDGDTLTLYSPDNNIIDAVSYTKALLNQSYNKISSGWKWSLTLTPGTKNIISKAAVLIKNLPSAKIQIKNSPIAQASLLSGANINQAKDINQTKIGTTQPASNPWFLFFTAMGMIILLAIILLFIKLKYSATKK